jgi:hypothetical protein
MVTSNLVLGDEVELPQAVNAKLMTRIMKNTVFFILLLPDIFWAYCNITPESNLKNKVSSPIML